MRKHCQKSFVTHILQQNVLNFLKAVEVGHIFSASAEYNQFFKMFWKFFQLFRTISQVCQKKLIDNSFEDFRAFGTLDRICNVAEKNAQHFFQVILITFHVFKHLRHHQHVFTIYGCWHTEPSCFAQFLFWKIKHVRFVFIIFISYNNQKELHMLA